MAVRDRGVGRIVRIAAITAVLLAVSAGATVQVFTIAMDRSLENGVGTMRLVTSSLSGYLERYGALPGLVADRVELTDLLRRPDDPAVQRTANLYLEDLARRLSISDAYVMLPDGETIAASNYAGVSFIGQNFRFRPYFQAAAEGRQGQFYGLGTTSDRRGFYFSDPIRVDGRIAGIIAFKIDLDPIEASWASNDTEILVVDPENIVFMSGRPDWRYRVFGASDETALARSSEVRRYADREIGTLTVRPSRAFDASPTIRIGSRQGEREYQALREEMPEAGWSVLVLADTRPALRQAVTAGATVLLSLALLTFVAASARSRRRRAAERQANEAAVKLRLEREVEQRTGALAQANRRLEEEIGERRATEERLRRTQSDLLEAGKLAALGQMSAALSHEFNQPLAAASAYADNATLLIERGEAARALAPVRSISGLLERLSTISRRLRNFARRPEEELVPVNVGEALGEAIAIARHRFEEIDATVSVEPLVGELEVQADAIRLQQVLLNLLTNAADALEGRPVRRIVVGARVAADRRPSIFVKDSGAGVPPAIAPRIFDPFFTSKAVGKGMGLGLSISYNIVGDFGGHLRLETPAEGGACFVIDFPAPVEWRSAAE